MPFSSRGIDARVEFSVDGSNTHCTEYDFNQDNVSAITSSSSSSISSSSSNASHSSKASKPYISANEKKEDGKEADVETFAHREQRMRVQAKVTGSTTNSPVRSTYVASSSLLEEATPTTSIKPVMPSRGNAYASSPFSKVVFPPSPTTVAGGSARSSPIMSHFHWPTSTLNEDGKERGKGGGSGGGGGGGRPDYSGGEWKQDGGARGIFAPLPVYSVDSISSSTFAGVIGGMTISSAATWGAQRGDDGGGELRSALRGGHFAHRGRSIDGERKLSDSSPAPLLSAGSAFAPLAGDSVFASIDEMLWMHASNNSPLSEPTHAQAVSLLCTLGLLSVPSSSSSSSSFSSRHTSPVLVDGGQNKCGFKRSKSSGGFSVDDGEAKGKYSSPESFISTSSDLTCSTPDLSRNSSHHSLYQEKQPNEGVGGGGVWKGLVMENTKDLSYDAMRWIGHVSNRFPVAFYLVKSPLFFVSVDDIRESCEAGFVLQEIVSRAIEAEEAVAIAHSSSSLPFKKRKAHFETDEEAILITSQSSSSITHAHSMEQELAMNLRVEKVILGEVIRVLSLHFDRAFASQREWTMRIEKVKHYLSCHQIGSGWSFDKSTTGGRSNFRSTERSAMETKLATFYKQILSLHHTLGLESSATSRAVQAFTWCAKVGRLISNQEIDEKASSSLALEQNRQMMMQQQQEQQHHQQNQLPPTATPSVCSFAFLAFPPLSSPLASTYSDKLKSLLCEALDLENEAMVAMPKQCDAPVEGSGGGAGCSGGGGKAFRDRGASTSTRNQDEKIKRELYHTIVMLLNFWRIIIDEELLLQKQKQKHHHQQQQQQHLGVDDDGALEHPLLA